jgi:pyrimidine operon attenuation protein / uracil phosphoribosyltransferase
MPPNFTTPTSRIPDAEHLYIQLLAQLTAHFAQCEKPPVIVGIHRGGAWLAARLHKDLGVVEPLCTIDISFYRDDFATKGVGTNIKTTDIPVSLDGRDVLLCDDILNSGRSVRAALSEVFDFGRPARVDLAVLFDRGGRELPVAARFLGGSSEFDAAYKLILERDASNKFCFRVPRRVSAVVADEVML